MNCETRTTSSFSSSCAPFAGVIKCQRPKATCTVVVWLLIVPMRKCDSTALCWVQRHDAVSIQNQFRVKDQLPVSLTTPKNNNP